MNNLDGGHSITPHSLSLSFSLAIVVASLAAAHPITQSPPPPRSLYFSLAIVVASLAVVHSLTVVVGSLNPHSSLSVLVLSLS